MINDDYEMKNIVWKNLFSLNLPLEWTFQEEDGVIGIFDAGNGVGVLQITIAKRLKNREPDFDEVKDLALDYANQRGVSVQDNSIDIFNINSSHASEFSFKEDYEETEFWKVWHILSKDRMAFLTYNCAFIDKDIEEKKCDQIVSSFRWL